MNIRKHTQTLAMTSELRTKALKLTLGASLLAVLAAGAMVLAPNSNQTAFAATPAPAPSSPSRIQGIPPIATPTPAPAGPSPIQGIAPIAPVTTLPVSGNNHPSPDAPRITALEETLVLPGDFIGIDGTQFGTSPGTVSLLWTNVLVDNAYTHNRTLSLTVADWRDTRVIAQVPPDVEGVPDELAHVVLTTVNGQASRDIQFMATHVFVMNPAVNVTTSCSSASDSDSCGTFWAHHFDYGFYNVGVFGTDSYQVRLANGWMYWELNITNQQGTTVLQKALAKGDTTFSFSVNWDFIGFNTDAEYYLNLGVYGPKGVPMQ